MYVENGVSWRNCLCTPHLIILKVLEIQIEYFIRNFLDDLKLFVLLLKAKVGGSVAEGKYLAI